MRITYSNVMCETEVRTSVTRFVEISPLWQNFENLWLFHEGFILSLANFGTYFGNIFAIGQIGIALNVQIL